MQVKAAQGFFLLDALIALLVVSVLMIEILSFAAHASSSVMKIRYEIHTNIDQNNRRAVELYR